MKSLEKLLLEFGLDATPLTDKERQYAYNFLANRAPAFDAISQQRADKPQTDLALGVLTQSFQTTFEAYQATQSTRTDMQQLFQREVGEAHASKFHTLDALELKVIATLWLLCQGYCGIDYSYANDQATLISQTLYADDADSHCSQGPAETLRQTLMHTYYIGVDHAKQAQPHHGFMATLTVTLKKWLS
ncbi:hypothetical protein L4C36_10280 [Photobacterium japonica]|uniref:hypothetical protein n=1 Tax=Photobacterium japonica TaxID=2910235 RepID=UPI003D113C54